MCLRNLKLKLQVKFITSMHFYPSKRKHSAVCTNRESDSKEISFKKLRPEIRAKENAYHRELQNLKKSIPCWENFFTVSERDRIDSWVRLEIIGNSLSDKFAWAVPDNRALKVLKKFSPLIEIGAGKGYFSKLLKVWKWIYRWSYLLFVI